MKPRRKTRTTSMTQHTCTHGFFLVFLTSFACFSHIPLQDQLSGHLFVSHLWLSLFRYSLLILSTS